MDTQTKTTTKPSAVLAPASTCPECGMESPYHATTCVIGKQHREAQARLDAANKAAAFPPPVFKPSVTEIKEAPYSWNVYAQDAEGWSEQFTIREVDSKQFVDKIAGIKEYFKSHGYTPAERGKGKASAPAASPTGGTAPAGAGDGKKNEDAWCEIHSCQMKWHDGQGGGWYSHKANNRDGKEYWCKGKAAKG